MIAGKGSGRARCWNGKAEEWPWTVAGGGRRLGGEAGASVASAMGPGRMGTGWRSCACAGPDHGQTRGNTAIQGREDLEQDNRFPFPSPISSSASLALSGVSPGMASYNTLLLPPLLPFPFPHTDPPPLPARHIYSPLPPSPLACPCTLSSASSSASPPMAPKRSPPPMSRKSSTASDEKGLPSLNELFPGESATQLLHRTCSRLSQRIFSADHYRNTTHHRPHSSLCPHM